MRLHYSVIIDELRRTQDAVLRNPGVSIVKAQFRALEDVIDKEVDQAIGEGVRLQRIEGDKARNEACSLRKELFNQREYAHKLAVALVLSGQSLPDPDDDGVI